MFLIIDWFQLNCIRLWYWWQQRCVSISSTEGYKDIITTRSKGIKYIRKWFKTPRLLELAIWRLQLSTVQLSPCSLEVIRSRPIRPTLYRLRSPSTSWVNSSCFHNTVFSHSMSQYSFFVISALLIQVYFSLRQTMHLIRLLRGDLFPLNGFCNQVLGVCRHFSLYRLTL